MAAEVPDKQTTSADDEKYLQPLVGVD